MEVLIGVSLVSIMFVDVSEVLRNLAVILLIVGEGPDAPSLTSTCSEPSGKAEVVGAAVIGTLPLFEIELDVLVSGD